ncbi:lycopene cyclase family protein [Flavobacterium sp.]|uniref:lycopene cyclase family protein n=1 Tax=Flavobacterium sp. TaxID=239 RepID=UPI002635812E|nr:lycopene cyclase family protein [Flavobacterium sp.]
METVSYYDYIFIGGGLSTLLTVDEMLKSKRFDQQRILILEAVSKNSNDRTWSFWESGKGKFDKIAAQYWDHAIFAAADFKTTVALHPYKYKTVESAAFYTSLKQKFEKSGIVTYKLERYENHNESAYGVVVRTETSVYNCKKLFVSVFHNEETAHQTKYPMLWQHFIGWKIRTKDPLIDPNALTFMDFDLPQDGNTRFMYVLPFSNTEALFEFTYFSPEIVADHVYTDAIKAYLNQRRIFDYEVYETEQGAIPMSCYPFWNKNSKHVAYIGSAGGWTKASTGFTFSSSRKKAKSLVGNLHSNFDFRKLRYFNRFWFYDLLFVDVLYRNNELGSAVFASLFKKLPAALILKFLDEETRFTEELRIFWACPKLPFVAALLRRMVGLSPRPL